MTVKARNRTPAALARRAGGPVPTYSQAELRERRVQGYRVLLPGGWSLTTEVAALCQPLAERVAARRAPRTYLRYVEDVTDAVRQLVDTVVALLAEADAQRRTRHLPIDQRGRALAAARALAQRPVMPEIGCEDVASGYWAQTLAELTEPYSDDLARLLGNALTSVVSDRVLRALAEVDHAARALERRLDRDEPTRATTPSQAITEADRARAELAELGVTL